MAGMGGQKTGQSRWAHPAQIDSLHRELHGEDTGHFGMIDAVDDPAVFSTLFTVAEEWLVERRA